MGKTLYIIPKKTLSKIYDTMPRPAWIYTTPSSPVGPSLRRLEPSPSVRWRALTSSDRPKVSDEDGPTNGHPGRGAGEV